MAAAAPGEFPGANTAFVAAFAVVKLVERERARAKMNNAGKVNEELEVREVVNGARANGAATPVRLINGDTKAEAAAVVAKYLGVVSAVRGSVHVKSVR